MIKIDKKFPEIKTAAQIFKREIVWYTKKYILKRGIFKSARTPTLDADRHESKQKLIINIFHDRSRDQRKASFTITTKPRCRGGCYSFSWIASLYPRYLLYIAECKARRYQILLFKSLV